MLIPISLSLTRESAALVLLSLIVLRLWSLTFPLPITRSPTKSISILTKGIDLKMPGDLKIINNKGVAPRSFRLKWWEKLKDKTFKEISFESKCKLPGYTVPMEIIPDTFFYSENEPIAFFGHYCRANGPHIIKPNLCCVDSCVSGAKTLTVYRWSGEKVLSNKNLYQFN